MSDDVRLRVARINSGFDTYADLRPVHQAFEAIAGRAPDLIAIEAAGTTISYGELDVRANLLAGRLADAGIGLEDAVGILADRSPDMVVGLLATLKAGASFIPLDPRMPAERVATIARDSELATILTQQDHLTTLTGLTALADQSPPLTVIPTHGGAAQPPKVDVSLDNAAYIYYTSGSTGTPKGVVIEHRCAAGRLEWLARRYQLGPGDRVLHKTPLIFDVAIWEIFGTLSAGATILMADPAAESDVAHIGRLLSAQRTVFGHFVPSMLNAYLQTASDRDYPDLRWIQLSGEAVPTGLLDRFREHFAAEFHSLYGQTETSEVAAWEGRTYDEGTTVPIGRQIGIYRLFVLDEALNLVPPGVPGELCVAGVGGLARGYLGRPGLTAQRFVPNPFAISPGERLYRTGDRAVVDDDGVITYAGRMDEQVKIRGCRVEPGEVAAVLARHPAVRDCAVVARPGEDGDTELVAYVVADVAAGQAGISELAAHAERFLPSYMLPSVYVPLEALPLGPTGKLDRHRLPAPTPAHRAARAGDEEPATLLQARLAELWTGVLGVAQVGTTDSFFRIGGNSLKALQLLSRVNAAFGLEYPVRDFFREPTISQMASNLERRMVEMVTALSNEEAADLLAHLDR
ncbi:MAG TPA: non-ribosomal peptide synthetase [Candidatus Limnocylindrales bacterium]|nr:non-ribosomal peptide synthetase [Candidatus Limnocylindrales bacterium]